MMLLVFDVFAIQPNFVAGSIASRLYIFIVGLLLKVLDVLKVFPTYSHKFSQIVS